MINEQPEVIKETRECTICGIDVGTLGMRAAQTSTFGGYMCYGCLSNPQFKSELVIHEVTELEHDLIVNGISHSGFFNVYTNGLAWLCNVTDYCKVVTPKTVKGVLYSLAEKGLLIVNEDCEDEESITLQLTAEGYTYYLKAIKCLTP